MLAAFGALCAVGTVLGWLLPKGRGCALVCFGPPEEGLLARTGWLREMGFLTVPLIVVAEGEWPGAEICSREELVSRLEREYIHGTGNGDHTGRHQRGGVPEL